LDFMPNFEENVPAADVMHTAFRRVMHTALHGEEALFSWN